LRHHKKKNRKSKVGTLKKIMLGQVTQSEKGDFVSQFLIHFTSKLPTYIKTLKMHFCTKYETAKKIQITACMCTSLYSIARNQK